jgi:uroporphyrinogen-III synthase
MIAAVGPGTAAGLRAWRLVADLVPDRSVAEGLLEAFPDPPRPGARVLLPRAAEGRDVLAEGLRAAGWDVDAVEAYRTVPLPISGPDREAAQGADAICFTSGSTVRGFVAAAGADSVPSRVVCIGPTTAAAAVAADLQVAAVAEPHTIDGLIDALVQVLKPGG